jgi:hypothetical protein
VYNGKRLHGSESEHGLINIQIPKHLYASLYLIKIGLLENFLAFICPPASVTNSFQENLARVAIKFGSREKHTAPFVKWQFLI